MKITPITFSGALPMAVLAGRKTMTRRIVHPQPEPGIGFLGCGPGREYLGPRLVGKYGAYFDKGFYPCPYGAPGDRLWVRESYFQFGHWEPVTGAVTRKTGRQKWRFVPDSDEIRYRDDPPADYRKGRHAADPGTAAWHQRLARFMPRAASRIVLEMVTIGVDRLHEITDEEAVAEGTEWKQHDPKLPVAGYAIGAGVTNDPRLGFRGLWESIHGAGSWDANPLVWVVEFALIDFEKNQLKNQSA